MVELIRRRSFLLGLGSLLAAPAIVHATNIMPVSAKLITPYREVLGEIRPFIGKSIHDMDGWVLCDGKRLAGFQPNFVPDLREVSAIDRRGRYFIYAGKEHAAHRSTIYDMVQRMKAHPQGEQVATIDYDELVEKSYHV